MSLENKLKENQQELERILAGKAMVAEREKALVNKLKKELDEEDEKMLFINADRLLDFLLIFNRFVVESFFVTYELTQELRNYVIALGKRIGFDMKGIVDGIMKKSRLKEDRDD